MFCKRIFRPFGLYGHTRDHDEAMCLTKWADYLALHNASQPAGTIDHLKGAIWRNLLLEAMSRCGEYGILESRHHPLGPVHSSLCLVEKYVAADKEDDKKRICEDIMQRVGAFFNTSANGDTEDIKINILELINKAIGIWMLARRNVDGVMVEDRSGSGVQEESSTALDWDVIAESGGCLIGYEQRVGGDTHNDHDVSAAEDTLHMAPSFNDAGSAMSVFTESTPSQHSRLVKFFIFPRIFLVKGGQSQPSYTTIHGGIALYKDSQVYLLGAQESADLKRRRWRGHCIRTTRRETPGSRRGSTSVTTPTQGPFSGVRLDSRPASAGRPGPISHRSSRSTDMWLEPESVAAQVGSSHERGRSRSGSLSSGSQVLDIQKKKRLGKMKCNAEVHRGQAGRSVNGGDAEACAENIGRPQVGGGGVDRYEFETTGGNGTSGTMGDVGRGLGVGDVLNASTEGVGLD